MSRVKSIRATHPIWQVVRIELDERGEDELFMHGAAFWSEDEALAERDRSRALNQDPDVRFELLESVGEVVYPADEAPPWVNDPDRWRKRGYEDPPGDDVG
jgi:hypothetical protein